MVDGMRFPTMRGNPGLPAINGEVVGVTPDGLFGWLASAPCGAFAVSLDQTIVFWWCPGGARLFGQPRCRAEML